MSPRQVSPMDSAFEEKLVAKLEELKAAMPRRQIFVLVEDDIEDEETLAKCLGRLVASGRLLRETRQRPGSTEDEFVYGAPTAQRARAIAVIAAASAAANKVATAPAAARTEEQKPITKAVPLPQAKEIKMPKGAVVVSPKSKPFLDYMTPARGFMGPTAIGAALGETAGNTAYHLKKLLAAKLIQVIGTHSTRKYGALGADPAATSEPTNRAEKGATAASPTDRPEKAQRKKKTRRSKTPCGPGAEAPATAAAQEAATPIRIYDPRAAGAGDEISDDIHCAIEDSGLFAINDGKATIRMKPKNIGKVVRFLELTQHVWKGTA